MQVLFVGQVDATGPGSAGLDALSRPQGRGFCTGTRLTVAERPTGSG
jgi:hypothetical protein